MESASGSAAGSSCRLVEEAVVSAGAAARVVASSEAAWQKGANCIPTCSRAAYAARRAADGR
jgi:hypothetical protein